ncbi:hypothetical protein MUK42_33081 [Musa troglodytarum]|uniref:Uncharacterized protein n=1 Tax=Musa troglodytarum TaxID=320322 RepID=A0A9E7LEP1_9LILI|nr:hypothetical protein MUK42_33081 [Musa troglodytarum]
MIPSVNGKQLMGRSLKWEQLWGFREHIVCDIENLLLAPEWVAITEWGQRCDIAFGQYTCPGGLHQLLRVGIHKSFSRIPRLVNMACL